MIAEAEGLLAHAAQLGRPGRFQIEAAIQSVHAERARTGRTDWNAIALFYERLVQFSPTLGAFVARAAAVAQVRGAARGLELLSELDAAAVATYQPYWAVRAHLLKGMNRYGEAVHAFDRAMNLADDEAVRRQLLDRLTEISQL